MPDGTPPDLGTLWGAAMCLPLPLCSPAQAPRRPCSTPMPKALPRRHKVSLSELRSRHRDGSPWGTHCAGHSQTSHPQSHTRAPGCLLVTLPHTWCPESVPMPSNQLSSLSTCCPMSRLGSGEGAASAPYKGHICSANRCFPSLQVEEMTASPARKRGVRRGGLPGDERR